jgi:hypothetical protein
MSDLNKLSRQLRLKKRYLCFIEKINEKKPIKEFSIIFVIPLFLTFVFSSLLALDPQYFFCIPIALLSFLIIASRDIFNYKFDKKIHKLKKQIDLINNELKKHNIEKLFEELKVEGINEVPYEVSEFILLQKKAMLDKEMDKTDMNIVFESVLILEQMKELKMQKENKIIND